MFTKIVIIHLILIVIANMIEADNICLGIINQTYNINNCYKCNGTWSRFFTQIDTNEFILTKDKIAFYNCQPGGKTVFIAATEQKLSFKFEQNDMNSVMVGDNAYLSCSVSIWAYTDLVKSKLEIYRTIDSVIGSEMHEFSNERYDGVLKSSISFDKNGNETYFCMWTISSQTGHFTANNLEIRSLPIRVYMAPRNVQPDKNVIKINETITCSSLADPVASYLWFCNGTDWSSDSTFLWIHKNGTYNCSCKAVNNIDNKDYHGLWQGYIEALTKEDYDNKFKQELSPGAIAGIVIGVIITLLIIIIIAWLVILKSNKQVMKMKGQGSNRVKVAEIGTEPFEVLENQIYSQHPKPKNVY